MKLNKEKFMKTEMGGELEETIRTWDKAIDERRKATPGIGNPDQGLGFKYWDNTCRSCQDRWGFCTIRSRESQFQQGTSPESTQRRRKSSCMTITWKETAKRRRTQYGRTNENR